MSFPIFPNSSKSDSLPIAILNLFIAIYLFILKGTFYFKNQNHIDIEILLIEIAKIDLSVESKNNNIAPGTPICLILSTNLAINMLVTHVMESFDAPQKESKRQELNMRNPRPYCEQIVNISPQLVSLY